MAGTILSLFNHLMVFLLLLQSSSLALRNYAIEFDEFKCIVNKIYTQSVSCSVAKYEDHTVLNADIQMKKEVQRSFIDISIYALAPKREPTHILKVNRMDYCELYKQKQENPIINMARDMCAKFGNPPDSCPIAADYHYKFVNLSLDTEYLPTVIPKFSLKTILLYYDNKVPYFNITVSARVVYKKSRNKGRKNS